MKPDRAPSAIMIFFSAAFVPFMCDKHRQTPQLFEVWPLWYHTKVSHYFYFLRYILLSTTTYYYYFTNSTLTINDFFIAVVACIIIEVLLLL